MKGERGGESRGEGRHRDGGGGAERRGRDEGESAGEVRKERG